MYMLFIAMHMLMAFVILTINQQRDRCKSVHPRAFRQRSIDPDKLKG